MSECGARIWSWGYSEARRAASCAGGVFRGVRPASGCCRQAVRAWGAARASPSGVAARPSAGCARGAQDLQGDRMAGRIRNGSAFGYLRHLGSSGGRCRHQPAMRACRCHRHGQGDVSKKTGFIDMSRKACRKKSISSTCPAGHGDGVTIVPSEGEETIRSTGHPRSSQPGGHRSSGDAWYAVQSP